MSLGRRRAHRPRAAEAVAALREARKGVVFLTNDVSRSPEEFVRKLWRLGFQASLDEVVTAGAALQFALAGRREGGAAFVIGVAGARSTTSPRPGCGSSTTRSSRRGPTSSSSPATGFDYGELRIATQAVLRGAELIGVTRDRTFPMPDGPWPGAGASSRRSRRPRARRTRSSASPSPGSTTPRATASATGRALAIGDRLDADVARRARAPAWTGARAHRRHATPPSDRGRDRPGGPTSSPTRSPL